MKDRITVVEMVCHQQENSEPHALESRFCRPIENSEQPYSRSFVVGETPKKLIDKYCWVENPGMIHVSNDEGNRLSLTPTSEETTEIEDRIIEIYNEGSRGWLVPPREPFRGTPVDWQTLMIRCLNGEAHYTLTVFPM